MQAEQNQEMTRRLKAAIKQRDQLSSDVERLKGKKEAAEKALADVQQECRDKKVDPSQIDAVLQKVETKFEQLVKELEGGVSKAEADLAPFLGPADEGLGDDDDDDDDGDFLL